MTTPVIDLMTPQSNSPFPTSTATTSIITTITSLPPTPPPQSQQSIADPILCKRIGKLEQHMTDLIQNNLALEERLDKHGSWFKLENLNIPCQVSKAVDEIVTDAVNWAMQAPLRAHFNHKNLFDTLQKSLERDYSDQLLSDLDEAHQKRRKRCDVPRTPSGSTPSLPPPPPPPAGASGVPGTSGRLGSSQMPPPPHPPSTGTSRSAQQQSTADQESFPTDSMMNDDSIPDEQVQLSDDEDTENDHLPKADTRKDWWKPLPE
ncbi:hypothetical protein Tco_0958387 [Tanacetum coccineum]